jgi:acyl-CoA reductase-like NAD-dependent aldehyde dehydrogenase
MTGPSGLLVGGHWLDEGEWMDVLDKFTRKPVRVIRQAQPDHVTRAVTCASEAVGGRPLDVRDRSEILQRAATVLLEDRATVMSDYVDETGFTAADASLELERAAEILRLSAQEALRSAGEVIPIGSAPGGAGRISYTIRRPVGVVVAIAPFNAPLSTVAHKIGPALAAGNSVVLKPALQTPLSAINLCRALLSAGLPGPYLSLLVGSGESVGQALVEDRRVRYFTFTGSTAVGLKVKQSSGIAKTHLELGGNCATIVCDDADLERAADLIVRGGYRKAGQVCTSVQRVLVMEKVAAELEEAIALRVKGLNVGDPHEAGTQVGPMISPDERVRAQSMVEQAVQVGARLLVGGGGSLATLEPTLLTDVPPEAVVMHDEIFAPVVAVRRVADLACAVELANDTRYGLQAGIFTKDLDRAFWAAERLEVGGVMINDTSSYHADLMPYGGMKDSGVGLEGPKYAIADMSIPSTIVINRVNGVPTEEKIP